MGLRFKAVKMSPETNLFRNNGVKLNTISQRTMNERKQAIMRWKIFQASIIRICLLMVYFKHSIEWFSKCHLYQMYQDNLSWETCLDTHYCLQCLCPILVEASVIKSTCDRHTLTMSLLSWPRKIRWTTRSDWHGWINISKPGKI